MSMPPTPMAFFGATIPNDGQKTDVDDTDVLGSIPAYRIRITMAAVDPTSAKGRATLKIHRGTTDPNIDSEDESDSDDEVPALVNGNSNGAPSKAKIVHESMEVDNAKTAEELSGEVEYVEYVLCTLDSENHYQQPLDFTIDPDEFIMFSATGDMPITISGNYIMAPDLESDDSSDEDYDGEDYGMIGDSDESDEGDSEDDEPNDELDNLADPPRITEVDSADDEMVEAPKKAPRKETVKVGKKRPAPDSDDVSENENDTKKPKEKAAAKVEEAVEAKLADDVDVEGMTKSQKKKLRKLQKKLKAENGQAVAPPITEKDTNAAAPTPAKKVQFAKELEQGPTGSPIPKPKADTDKTDSKKAAKAENTPSGATVVEGVTISDRSSGSGKKAGKGDMVSVRYIGKLDNGKVFDSNKTGPPFKFKIGDGGVIRGWEVGVVGMQQGGQRRLVIPPGMAYGKKGSPPDIPSNSTLTFDLKLLSIGK